MWGQSLPKRYVPVTSVYPSISDMILRRRERGNGPRGDIHPLPSTPATGVVLFLALLFVGGVMNLLWIAVLAILILLEKLTPCGRVVARIAGIGFIASGVWMLARGF